MMPPTPLLDLRSDTVTRPTAGMRAAMAAADVGDDVFGEDPTVQRLERRMAELTGKEACLFVTSGTMGNQLAIATQTRPGDDVVVGEGAHPVFYEGGAGAALSGVQFSVAGRGGLFTPEELEAALHPRVYYAPRTSLVMVENTHNRSGGRVWPPGASRAVAERAHELGLAAHLDGARVWNASVATGVDVATLSAPFDTVSACFSKGLGAPVGSALSGPRALVEDARRLRKRWGGGMRQAGILAAAALYALERHRERLGEDHQNARRLAERMAGVDGVRVDVSAVETNIVNLDLDVSAAEVAAAARDLGVLIAPSGPRRLRAVLHLDVPAASVDAAADVLARAVRTPARTRP